MTPDEAVEHVRARVSAGELTTWFASGRGRSLAVVSNTSRAMVMLLDAEGDPGEHAVTPGATGSSDGFVLENDQSDTYPDADTATMDAALTIVHSLVASGAPPKTAAWQVDR